MSYHLNYLIEKNSVGGLSLANKKGFKGALFSPVWKQVNGGSNGRPKEKSRAVAASMNIYDEKKSREDNTRMQH